MFPFHPINYSPLPSAQFITIEYSFISESNHIPSIFFPCFRSLYDDVWSEVGWCHLMNVIPSLQMSGWIPVDPTVRSVKLTTIQLWRRKAIAQRRKPWKWHWLNVEIQYLISDGCNSIRTDVLMVSVSYLNEKASQEMTFRCKPIRLHSHSNRWTSDFFEGG